MPDTPPPELVVQVRAEMLRQSLTLESLADRMGLPLGTLRNRLSSRNPGVANLEQIAAALGTTLSVLAARAEQVKAA